MNKILLFAGTTEGRAIAEYLRGSNVQVYVCVATDYGKELIQESKNVKVLAGRLDTSEMKYFIRKNAIERVIDATHPFAIEVTENIKKACKDMRITYHRVLRERDGKESDVIYVETIADAVAYLQDKKGKVLITTGSKELSLYTKLSDYRERCYARVLSTKEAMAESAKLGFEGAHLIAMQGPFTELMNEAILEQVQADYFVTKESGNAGGYLEKIMAARKTKTKVIVIGRKVELEGQTVEEVYKELKSIYDIVKVRKVYLVGVGTGNEAYLIGRAKEVLSKADIVLGAQRMLDYAKEEKLPYYEAYQPKEVCEYLRAHNEYQNIAIALSGDASFYSGAKRLKKALDEYDIEIVPGISSVVYLASRLQTELEDAAILSQHGRSCNVIGALKSAGRVYLLMESKKEIKILCEELIHFGYEKVLMSIGSKLSYGEEQIVTGYPKDCMERNYDDLSVVYLEDKKWSEPIVTYGFPDEAFVRGDVPMTKSEIRSISISKMRLTRDAIVYDIGAGTGSVSVEAARQAVKGIVYAIEKKAKGIELIKQNQEKFAVPNVVPIEGNAPEAFENLPMPTHAFIGGSGGKLKDICDRLLLKNKNIRIVINAVTLETMSECLQYLKENNRLEQAEFTNVSIAKAETVGTYQMMAGQNPVYIVAFGGKKYGV